jgi:hypothetical protein
MSHQYTYTHAHKCACRLHMWRMACTCRAAVLMLCVTALLPRPVPAAPRHLTSNLDWQPGDCDGSMALGSIVDSQHVHRHPTRGVAGHEHANSDSRQGQCTAKPDLVHLSEILHGSSGDSEAFLGSASKYLWTLLQTPLQRNCTYTSLTAPLAKVELPDNVQVSQHLTDVQYRRACCFSSPRAAA